MLNIIEVKTSLFLSIPNSMTIELKKHHYKGRHFLIDIMTIGLKSAMKEILQNILLKFSSSVKTFKRKCNLI